MATNKNTKQADALAADLAGLGNGVSMEALDGIPTAAPTTSRVPTPVESGGEAVPSAPQAKAAPVKKAKAAPVKKESADANLPPHFEVKVEGEYFFSSDETKRKGKRTYSETFRVVEYDGLLSTIKKHLLNDRLSKKDPEFRAVRTHYVVSVEPKNGMPMPPYLDVLSMSYAQLVQHIKVARITAIDVDAYGDNLPKLKDAVMDFLNNPIGFANREAKRQELLRTSNLLGKLNS